MGLLFFYASLKVSSYAFKLFPFCFSLRSKGKQFKLQTNYLLQALLLLGFELEEVVKVNFDFFFFNPFLQFNSCKLKVKSIFTVTGIENDCHWWSIEF